MTYCQRCADLEREVERLRDEIERRSAEGVAIQDRAQRAVAYALEACLVAGRGSPPEKAE